MVQVVSHIFNYMDTVVNSFVSENLSPVISAVTPTVAAALSIALTVDGVFMFVRPSTEPLTTLMTRFFRYGIILSIATAGGLYQETIANAIMKTPDEFSNVLIMSASNTRTPAGLASAIDTVFTQGLMATQQALEGAGIWNAHEIACLFLAFCIMIATTVICALGAAYVLFAKFLLAVSVVLGPIAILCLLFKTTTGLFGKWMGTCIHYGLVTVLTSVVFGLMDKFYLDAVKAATSTNGDDPVLVPTATCIILTIVTCYVMKQVPEMAARLGDGAQVGLPGLIDAISSGMGRSGAGGQRANTKALNNATKALQAASGPAGAAAAAASTVANAAGNAARGLARGASG